MMTPEPFVVIRTLRPHQAGELVRKVKTAISRASLFTPEYRALIVKRRQDWATWMFDPAGGNSVDIEDVAVNILSCCEDSEVIDRAVDKAVGYLLGRELTAAEVNALVLRNLSYLSSQDYLARKARREPPPMEDFWLPLGFIVVVLQAHAFLCFHNNGEGERTHLLGMEAL